MSLNHIRQAQQLAISKKLDSINRAILVDIAADIGYDGSPAFPSYATISERTGYHKNTVANRVMELVESGILNFGGCAVCGTRGYTIGHNLDPVPPKKRPFYGKASYWRRIHLHHKAIGGATCTKSGKPQKPHKGE